MTRLKATLLRIGLRVNSKKITLMRINAFSKIGEKGAGLKTAEAKLKRLGISWSETLELSRAQWSSVVDDLCSTTA